MLTEGHASLRDDFEISTVELDACVDAALAAGAHGARMVGGGFGGSAVVLVDRDRAGRVAAAVRIDSRARATPRRGPSTSCPRGAGGWPDRPDFRSADQARTVTGTRWTMLFAMPWRFHGGSTGWVSPVASVARASSS